MAEHTVVGIHHIHVTVPIEALSEAQTFYLGVLGLKEKPKPEPLKVYPGFWVETTGPDLHIGGENTSVDRRQSGAHVALEVQSPEILEDLQRKLEGLGINTSPMVVFPGYTRFEFRDPWGNRTELTTPTAALSAVVNEEISQ